MTERLCVDCLHATASDDDEPCVSCQWTETGLTNFVAEVPAGPKMTTKNTGGSAFPLPCNEFAHGMTLRDYFAGQALAGQGAWIPPMKIGEGHIEAKARFAYDLADAMLAEREK